MADTEITGRTGFFQKEGRVMPVDHLANTGPSPETVEKPYAYIRSSKVT